jgi:hypothetical protein
LLDDAKPGSDPLPDHRPLELSECARELKQQLARWRRRVDRLLVQVEIDVYGL